MRAPADRWNSARRSGVEPHAGESTCQAYGPTTSPAHQPQTLARQLGLTVIRNPETVPRRYRRPHPILTTL